MSVPPFLSLAEPHEAEQTIKKSRFIGNAAPITSEEDAQAFLTSVSDALPKANHHTFAYVIGDHDEITRQSDGGEPSGTAGSPLLNVITRLGLHNVIIVVTRFFGGIKLGAGGLIRAYGSTASLAAAGSVVARQRLARYQITLSYQQAEPLTPWLTDRVVTVVDTAYAVAVTFTVLVNAADATFVADLTSKTNGQAQIVDTGETFAFVPYDPETTK
ncbi:IMPACT family protein [Furfurilactobacillus sp. WILCCON 0119]